MEKLHRDYRPRGVVTTHWVDDVQQRAEGPQHVVLEKLVAAGRAFAQGARDLDLGISPKSGAIASTLVFAKQLAAAMQGAGIPVTAQGVMPDLGIERGHRRHQRKPKHSMRVKGAKKSLDRMKDRKKKGEIDY